LGLFGLSCYYAMRYALYDFLQQLPDCPASIHINDLAGDEI
jgi:hypothetical protein